MTAKIYNLQLHKMINVFQDMAKSYGLDIPCETYFCKSCGRKLLRTNGLYEENDVCLLCKRNKDSMAGSLVGKTQGFGPCDESSNLSPPAKKGASNED